MAGHSSAYMMLVSDLLRETTGNEQCNTLSHQSNAALRVTV